MDLEVGWRIWCGLGLLVALLAVLAVIGHRRGDQPQWAGQGFGAKIPVLTALAFIAVLVLATIANADKLPWWTVAVVVSMPLLIALAAVLTAQRRSSAGDPVDQVSKGIHDAIDAGRLDDAETLCARLVMEYPDAALGERLRGLIREKRAEANRLAGEAKKRTEDARKAEEENEGPESK